SFVQGPPSSVTAGATFSPNVTVQVIDTYGNPNVGLSVNMTRNGGGTLSGTTSRTRDSSGVATFNDLSATLAGSGKSLTATVVTPSLTVTSSPTFTVNPDVVAKMAFTSAAVSVAAGVASSSITVQRQDQFNNPVTTEGTRTVTLSSSSVGTVVFNPTSLS